MKELEYPTGGVPKETSSHQNKRRFLNALSLDYRTQTHTHTLQAKGSL